jgi:SulP family sulfate permease
MPPYLSFLYLKLNNRNQDMHAERAALAAFFPIVDWLKNYRREDISDDVFAGVITAILLVPQGIAYALLAGLPPQLGLYASILPPIVYALLGTSRTLSVGPVSVAAIMIASALTAPEISALGNPIQSGLILSAEIGAIMLAMAMLRMGGLVNFISHPVLAGFTSGAALLIIVNQLPQVFGVKMPTCALDLGCYAQAVGSFSAPTLAISLGSLALLIFFGSPLTRLLKKLRVNLSAITAISKCGPLLTVILSTLAVSYADFGGNPVAIVGPLPSGFPSPHFTSAHLETWRLLLPYAGFIGLISYVESVAIAKVTANLRGEKIAPNQELIALGSANLTAFLFGGMPVAGGFSRTMVNFSAGARTQMAMIIAATLLGLSVIFLSASFANIPKAALAAIILVAIFRLVRIKHILHTWRYDGGDGMAELATLLGVLVFGIEQGITLGIILTIASHLRKTSQPHIAVVGRVPDTEHFRNIKRHSVETWHHLLLVRIDESITFANVSYIEDYLAGELKRQPNTRHIVLILSAVNDIDATALDALELFNQGLQASGKTLNLSEAQDKVMDKLEKTDFFEQLQPGKVFARTEDAVKALG